MSKYTKYPRTPHLPWSRGRTVDDIVLDGRGGDIAHFEGREVVVTEKLDGENTSMYRDRVHARSIDSGAHPSRTWVRRLHGRLGYQIPSGWRLCGENMYAVHSIAYADLASYFYLFSVWDETNRALSWDDTLTWSQLLDIATPRVLYRGVWDIARLGAIRIDPNTTEGWVVRVTEAFEYHDFGTSVAKWVRKNHVRTDEHWMSKPVVPNTLSSQRASVEQTDV